MNALESHILTVPNISPLTFDDEPLLQTIFPRGLTPYSSSWLYALRASHGDDGSLGYKYLSPRLVAIIGFRNEIIYVTPIIDITHGQKLNQLCHSLSDKTQLQIIIKKFHKPSLAQTTLTTTTALSGRLLEDGSYPETMLELPKLFAGPAAKINPAAENFLRSAKKFEPVSSKLTIIEDLSRLPLKRIEQFLAHDSSKYANCRQMVRYLATQNPSTHRYQTLLFVDQDRVRGLYIAERLSLTDMGLYCAITSKDEPGITEWTDAYFFKRLFTLGIQTVHLGGAENIGIHQFIRKLLAHRPAYHTDTVVFDAKAQNVPSRITIRPAQENDIQQLAALYRSSYNTLTELGEYWTKAAAHAFISHFYRRQPDLFFVAEQNDSIIGACVAAIQPWWDGNHLVEGELFINSEYKEEAVEKKLLQALLSRAHDAYRAVAWDTITPTCTTHPLASYKKLGFTEVPYWKAISGDTHTILERLGH
jgi:L-amino acid N-acyltransferase YncA